MDSALCILFIFCASLPGAYLQGEEPGAIAGGRSISGSVVSPDEYQWGSWGRWADCSATCGQGIRRRQRSCYFYRLTGSGALGARGFEAAGQCPGNNVDETSCDTGSCPPCLGPWSSYDRCSVTCGTGIQIRRRTCRPGCSFSDCGGALEESQNCAGNVCYGSPGEWTEWSLCSEVCGPGRQTRTRFCTGGPCAPNVLTSDTQTCNLQRCGWGTWGSWSRCDIQICEQRRERTCPSNTCTTGHFIRLRSCRPVSSCLSDPTIPAPRPRPPGPSVPPTRVCRTDALRIPCGGPEIGENDCYQRGCCYDDFIQLQGIPYCFQKTFEGPVDPRN